MKLNVLKIEKIIDGENKIIFPVLIQNENRNYLVDCGYKETFGELKSELESLGIGINDLTGVIITHDDYDHLGSLKLLKQDNINLKIYCGEYEKDSVPELVRAFSSYLPNNYSKGNIRNLFIHCQIILFLTIVCVSERKFPMYQKENPTQVRILEIYANKTAYESHIKSPHFQEYKTSTLKMVKSLKLIDMNSIDPETMAILFRKLNQ